MISSNQIPNRLTLTQSMSLFSIEAKCAGLEDSTAKSYLYDLKDLKKYLRKKLPSVRYMPQITSEVIDCYVDWLKEQRMSPNTIHRRLTALSRLFTYLVGKRALQINPLNYLVQDKKIFKHTKDKSILSVQEIDQIVSSIYSGKTYYRDVCLIYLLYYVAPRKSEALQLNWDCVNFKRREILIYRKKNKTWNTLPIDPKLLKVLMLLFEQENPISLQEPVFKGVRGRRLCTSSLNRVFKLIIQRSNIQKDQPITCHSLRHSFCTNQSNSGTDLDEIKKYTGHQSYDILRNYIHVDWETKKNLINKIAS